MSTFFYVASGRVIKSGIMYKECLYHVASENIKRPAFIMLLLQQPTHYEHGHSLSAKLHILDCTDTTNPTTTNLNHHFPFLPSKHLCLSGFTQPWLNLCKKRNGLKAFKVKYKWINQQLRCAWGCNLFLIKQQQCIHSINCFGKAVQIALTASVLIESRPY